ncbi:MAG: HEAT repeat domain-containing protein, partial [Gemmatimonadota bacterium]
DATARVAARMALAALASPDSASADEARAQLESALEADEVDARVLAASALGEAGDPRAGEALVRALDDPEPNVVAAAADALGILRYARALEPLAELSRSGDYWVRAAAVVALGRLEDERAVPVLERLAREPGLAKPVVEALRHIGHPVVLTALGRVREAAPEDALRAAGAVLAAHPDTPAPDWVVVEAGRHEDYLRAALAAEDDPGIARLLGLAASDTAVETLFTLVGPPRRSDAAVAGITALPDDRRSDAILDRLRTTEGSELAMLLALLPAVTDPARARELVPLLAHGGAEVRAAAAEALGRAPAKEALSLLTAELSRQEAAPEVIRAVGGLGEVACASLIPLLGDPSPEVRAAAANALARCAGHAVEAELRDALGRETDPGTRQALLQAVGRAAGEAALDVLVPALEDEELDVRLAAIEALGSTGSDAAVTPLSSALQGSRAERVAALRGLGRIGSAAAAAPVGGALDDSDPDIRRAAALAAAELRGGIDERWLDRMVRDEDALVRSCAARILAREGEAGRPRLEAMAAGDPDPGVREKARRGLRGTG